MVNLPHNLGAGFGVYRDHFALLSEIPLSWSWYAATAWGSDVQAVANGVPRIHAVNDYFGRRAPLTLPGSGTPGKRWDRLITGIEFDQNNPSAGTGTNMYMGPSASNIAATGFTYGLVFARGPYTGGVVDMFSTTASRCLFRFDGAALKFIQPNAPDLPAPDVGELSWAVASWSPVEQTLRFRNPYGATETTGVAPSSVSGFAAFLGARTGTADTPGMFDGRISDFIYAESGMSAEQMDAFAAVMGGMVGAG